MALKIPFNPKAEAMAGSGMRGPHVAPAIASGFGLNEAYAHFKLAAMYLSFLKPEHRNLKPNP